MMIKMYMMMMKDVHDDDKDVHDDDKDVHDEDVWWL